MAILYCLFVRNRIMLSVYNEIKPNIMIFATAKCTKTVQMYIRDWYRLTTVIPMVDFPYFFQIILWMSTLL